MCIHYAERRTRLDFGPHIGLRERVVRRFPERKVANVPFLRGSDHETNVLLHDPFLGGGFPQRRPLRGR